MMMARTESLMLEYNTRMNEFKPLLSSYYTDDALTPSGIEGFMSWRELLSGLVVATLLAACGPPPPKPEPIRALRVFEVGVVAGLSTGELPGRARSAREVDLAFDVSGRLIERPVAIGDRVNEGELIARLDPRDFQARLKAAEADALNSERNFARGKDLLKKSFVSQAEIDRLEANVDINQAQVALARKALSDSVIRAPFDGMISNLMVENFQSVPAKKDVARLLGTQRIEMVVNLSESQIANLERVDTIEVVFDAFPNMRLLAEITEIGREASTTTRTFPITLSMKQPAEQNILAGMAGVAIASGRFDQNTLPGYVIPASAFIGQAADNASEVWVVGDDNRVARRSVIIGDLTAGGVSVLGGLEAGELVATAGVHTLSEGQEVRVERSGG
jgi:RND family efflux transporter MFP subunit